MRAAPSHTCCAYFIHIHMYAQTCGNTHVHTNKHSHSRQTMLACMYIRVYVCMYVCMQDEEDCYHHRVYMKGIEYIFLLPSKKKFTSSYLVNFFLFFFCSYAASNIVQDALIIMYVFLV